jgi:hypothetical protein
MTDKILPIPSVYIGSEYRSARFHNLGDDLCLCGLFGSYDASKNWAPMSVKRETAVKIKRRLQENVGCSAL